MKLVLADTNALMSPFQFGYNLDLELERILGLYDLFIPRAVRKELMVLAEHNRDARAALNYISKIDDHGPEWARECADDVSDITNADNQILAFLRCGIEKDRRQDLVLFTNDKEIRNESMELGIKCLILRGGNHLDFYRPDK